MDRVKRSPVDRVGRFWTLMPKLLRGSSESSASTAGPGGAWVAVDCTERAREPSLELLFESLLPENRAAPFRQHTFNINDSMRVIHTSVFELPQLNQTNSFVLSVTQITKPKLQNYNPVPSKNTWHLMLYITMISSDFHNAENTDGVTESDIWNLLLKRNVTENSVWINQ